MVIQENDFCNHQGTCEQNINRMKSNREHIPLRHIYDVMNTIRKIPMIETQMDVARQGREIMMKQHENEHQKI